MIERIKAAVASQEFKNITNFENPKGTVFNLDNIFYGSMLVAIGMAITFSFKAWGLYVLVIPAAIFVLGYIGRFIRLVIATNPLPPEQENPVVEEKPYVVKPKTPRKKKSI